MQKASVHLTINVASLEIMDEVSSSDRRGIECVIFGEVLEKAFFRGSIARARGQMLQKRAKTCTALTSPVI
jgi:hypothetical protein